MASSRIYLMVHYFSDCVGAFAVGIVSGLIAFLIVKWIYRSKIKLFVWARELDIFHTKKENTVKVIKNEDNTQVANENYEYLTQEQENMVKTDNIEDVNNNDIKDK